MEILTWKNEEGTPYSRTFDDPVKMYETIEHIEICGGEITGIAPVTDDPAI